jgi:hypothetical protein
MQGLAAVASVTILGSFLVAAPALAAPPHTGENAKPAALTDISAQSRPRRARTRIRVTPLSPYPYRTFHSPYPLPYTYEYPGPGATRDCQARLVQEWRPSGTVIVPRMTCWWVRG